MPHTGLVIMTGCIMRRTRLQSHLLALLCCMPHCSALLRCVHFPRPSSVLGASEPAKLAYCFASLSGRTAYWACYHDHFRWCPRALYSPKHRTSCRCAMLQTAICSGPDYSRTCSVACHIVAHSYVHTRCFLFPTPSSVLGAIEPAKLAYWFASLLPCFPVGEACILGLL